MVLQTSIPGAPNPLVPPIELILRLAQEFPNLVYVKEESPPLVARMKEEVRHHDLLKGVFGASGGDGLLYEMRLGLDGEMTGQGAYGDVMVAMYRSLRPGQAGCRHRRLCQMAADAQLRGQDSRHPAHIFVKRGVFKSAAARPGATGAMMGRATIAGRHRGNRNAVCDAQALAGGLAYLFHQHHAGARQHRKAFDQVFAC